MSIVESMQVFVVPEDDYRYPMDSPLRQVRSIEDWIVASQGQIMGLYRNTTGEVADPFPDTRFLSITRSIIDFLDKVPYTRYDPEVCDTGRDYKIEDCTCVKRCDECDGKGVTECEECGHTRDCPKCDGEGEVYDPKCPQCHGTGNQRVEITVKQIGDKWFDNRLLEMLTQWVEPVEYGVSPEYQWLVLCNEAHTRYGVLMSRNHSKEA